MRQGVRLMILAGIGACAGFGCAKPPEAAPLPAEKPATTQSQAAFPTFVAPEKVLSPKEELSNILKQYNDTKSFRARVNSRTSQGDFVGAMEFSKPDRFHAIIRSGPKNDTEIVIVGKSFYLKPQDKDWQDLSSTRGAQTLGEAMRTALTENTLEHVVLDEKVTVEKSEDSIRSCTLYIAHIMDDAGGRDVNICAADGLPKIVDMKMKDGTNTIEYFDFNEVFSIYKPLP